MFYNKADKHHKINNNYNNNNYNNRRCRHNNNYNKLILIINNNRTVKLKVKKNHKKILIKHCQNLSNKNYIILLQLSYKTILICIIFKTYNKILTTAMQIKFKINVRNNRTK